MSLGNANKGTIKTSRGFTLLELVIVMIIMAIIGIFIAFRTPSIDLSDQTIQVINNIHYAQSLAIAANFRHRFYFGSNTYTIASYDQSTGVETLIYFPQAGTNSVTLASGIFFSKPPTPNCLAFNGRGQPCDCVSGKIFTSDTTIRLSSRITTKDAVIAASTGYTY
jgi:prepilin-type N-terminal cleavage/methylation domain-containing protein